MNKLKLIFLNKFIVFLMGYFISSTVVASNDVDKDNWKEIPIENALDYPMAQTKFVIPIIDKRVYLSTSIPETFVHPPKFGDDKHTIYEFIPKTNKRPYNWSENIVVQVRIEGLSAKDFLKKMIKLFSQASKDIKILSEDYTTGKSYSDGNALIVYTSPTGRRELLKIYAISGVHNSASVQYAILLKSDNEINNMVKHLNNFFKNNLSIKLLNITNSIPNPEQLKSATSVPIFY